MIGVMFMIFIDILVWTWLSKTHPGILKAYRQIQFLERLVIIAIWPICLIIFIKAIWDQHNEEN
jgi:hypothetical protein